LVDSRLVGYLGFIFLFMDPLVSVIMPCFNGEATISKAIDSVLMQSFREFELIIVDDASSDGSIKIIEGYERIDERVVNVFNTEGKRGPSHARNAAIKLAKGRFLCFLDCDDYLVQDSLRRRVDLLLAGAAPVVFGPYLRFEGGSHFNPVPSRETVSFKDMLKRNLIGNLTGMYDSKKVGKIFQKDLRHEDYLMWCEILKVCDFAKSTGCDYLGVYRVSSDSLSGNKIKAALWHWNVLRAGLNIHFFRALTLQFSYVFSSIRNRFFSFQP